VKALPKPGDRLEVPGFRLGHASDPRGMTGVTVVLCEEGALAAAEVRGSATGTRQFDSLVAPGHVSSKAHAVVLAGGSGFGLAAADPVVDALAADGHGFRTPLGVVPIVPTAILFDLGFGDPGAHPDDAMVRRALAAARRGRVACGSLGAGTGATVGKANGLPCAMKGGFGFRAVRAGNGLHVAAAVAVNAFGDVRDPATGSVVAGCRSAPRSRRLLGADRVLAALPADTPHPWQGNTTLAVVMTDAVLDKASALKVCQMAFGGFYRALLPALTLFDGDLLVTLTSGRVRADLHQVAVLAEHVLAAAIVAAAREADGFGLLPSAREMGRPR
jgi:L-aminopeptidase/D-esterase-like protein